MNVSRADIYARVQGNGGAASDENDRGTHSHEEDEMRTLWPHRNILFGLNDGKTEDPSSHHSQHYNRQKQTHGSDTATAQSETAHGDASSEAEASQ